MSTLQFSVVCINIPKVLKERTDMLTEPASVILEGSESKGMDPEACSSTNVVQIFKGGELVNVKDGIPKHMTSLPPWIQE